MRETLTVLAGLLVAILLAALIGPGFVDWRAYRPQIEARLSTALGVETSVAGGISLRLLPSPRLSLGAVRVGAVDGARSSATIEQVTVELALAALARGEFRFSHAAAEGATLNAVLDAHGALQLPMRSSSGLPAQTSLDQVSIRRSALVWREPGKAPVTLAPIAAELSAVSLEGPWRVEGEVAGTSLRVSTGVIEPDGRLRAKASLTGEALQLGFDGNFRLAAGGDAVGLGLEGAFTLAPGGAVALTGRVNGGSRQLDLSGLVLDIAGGAAKLEGEGQYRPDGGTGTLALRARRLDVDALSDALADRAGFAHALTALPGNFDVSLDLDQVIWRGEDFSAFSLRGRLDDLGLSDANASVRVAGALLGASGAIDAKGVAGRLNLKAEDSRRVALVLGRAGLDAALADLIAGLGRIDADAVGAWDGGRIAFERLLVTGSSGIRLEGSGDIMPERLAARLALSGLDLSALPPAESFSGLVGGRDLALDLALNNARYRNAPPGSASLDLRREGAVWRLSRLAIDGFGGIGVTGNGTLLAEGGEISGRVRAPRFETLAALAGPVLPDSVRQALGRVGDGLARLDASFRLTRAASAETAVSVEGTAQAGKLALDGRIDKAGVWSSASLRFDLTERRQVFAALGLPQPQLGGPGRLTLEQRPERLAGSLAGTGLSVVLEGTGAAAGRLTVQADRPGQILPDGPARLLPDALFDANAKVAITSEAVSLDDIVVNLGATGARGSLALAREGGVSGRLVLPSVDLRAVLGGVLGAGPAAAGAGWSTVRFGQTPPLGDLKLSIEAGTLVVAEGASLNGARFALRADRDGAGIDDLTAAYAGGQISGRVALRREGGLGQLTGRIGLAQLDLGTITKGALGGKLSGQLEAGGSGESPARLIAGLGGSGALQLNGASLARFDPNAYSRLIDATGEDASESEAARLQERLGKALDQAAWPLGDIALPFTLAGGLARLQPLSFQRNGLRAEASGLVDLRAFSADVRLGLRPLGPLPKGWPTDAPQVVVAWRGPLTNLQRETDVGALSNAVAARALAREIERVEAFEADARERAANSRRLRAERETRENERKLAEFLKAEEERRIAEEKRAEEARRAEEKRIEDARRAEEARRLAEDKRAEELRRVEEARRVAEERRAEEAKRADEQRQEQEIRRRIEAELRAERARAVAERAAAERAPQPGPLVLPSAPREVIEDANRRAAPPLAPPLDIQSIPRPLSRSSQPN